MTCNCEHDDPQALVGDGTYASKGSARRALGIEESLPPISRSLTRLIGGLTGAHPKPPNVHFASDIAETAAYGLMDLFQMRNKTWAIR